MRHSKNEVAHYPEIMRCVEMQLQSNFRAAGVTDLKIYWKSGELTAKIKELVQEHPDTCSCMAGYSRSTPPLNLDIFAVVTDGRKYEIVILEVKLREAVGLNQWSQLIGYNLVSNARYGLLINIDAGASSRLEGILASDVDASRIVRQKADGTTVEHLLGFMEWNTVTQNFEYSGWGQIHSLSALSKALISRFEYHTKRSVIHHGKEVL